METLEAILSRRSIRMYRDEALSGNLLHTFLQAAMAAPSANNLQPWCFIVIKDRKLLQKITEYHPYAAMLTRAAAAILVCGDLQRDKNIGYVIQDCAAATQNILLAAHAAGAGAVWLGIYPREERIAATGRLFRLPRHILPVSLVSLGYPVEHKEPGSRYDPDKVFLDLWGKKYSLF